MEKLTLKEIFLNGKQDLVSSLSGLTLPKDSKKVQKIVSDFFSKLFENDAPYRQSLTESEDYLLMSALQVLKSQQNIIEEISKVPKPQNSMTGKDTSQTDVINPYVTLAGTGVGALVGSIAGTWAAVAGSIAGTALVIYYSTHASKKSNVVGGKEKENWTEDTINVDAFVDIVEKICESIDGVIETYRVQVQKIRNTYERREKPSLLTDYRNLLDQIANVCNIAGTLTDTVPQKLFQAIKMMEESLENYDLKFDNGKIVNC